jgi:hypothetical protein
MKKIDAFIERLNFKKAIRIYLFLSVLAIAICGFSMLFIARDTISMAWNYKKVSHTFEKQGVTDSLKTQLNSLMSSSKDLENILIVDKSNSIIYKANDNLIQNQKNFQLNPMEYYRNYLTDNINKNVIYKVVKDDDIILNKDYIQNHRKIESDINDSFSFEKDLGSNDIYLLNYMSERNTENKLFIIRTVSEIPYLEGMLGVAFVVIGLIFAFYWIGLALWVYKNATKKNTNAPLWGLLVLVTNIVGVIVYLMYIQNSILCNTCGSVQNKNNKYCSTCGSKINNTCNKCGNVVSTGENYCKNCGENLENK